MKSQIVPTVVFCLLSSLVLAGADCNAGWDFSGTYRGSGGADFPCVSSADQSLGMESVKEIFATGDHGIISISGIDRCGDIELVLDTEADSQRLRQDRATFADGRSHACGTMANEGIVEIRGGFVLVDGEDISLDLSMVVALASGGECEGRLYFSGTWGDDSSQ